MLESRRLVVRPTRPADAAALHEVYGDPEVARAWNLRGPWTAEQTAEHLSQQVAAQRARGYSMWAVVERSSGLLIGDAGFADLAEGGVEVRWNLRRDRWERGYGTEAARLVIGHGFAQLGFPAISAYVALANTRALRIVFKLGMRFVRGGADGVPPWEEHRLRAEEWHAQPERDDLVLRMDDDRVLDRPE